MASEKEFYSITSANRVSGSIDDFTYKIEFPNGNKFNRIAVSYASIPKSYLLFDSSVGNNTFVLTELGVDTTVTIPEGNYNQTSFASTLKTQLDLASPNTWVYSVTFSNSTTSGSDGKYTFGVSGNSGQQPSFTFTDYVYYAMGFDENSTATFVSDSLVSENVIKLQLIDTVQIHSSICQNFSNDICQTIPVQSIDFSFIQFLNPDIEGNSRQLSTNANNLYTFRITDGFGNPIDFNGIDLSFEIVVFREKSVYDLLKFAIDLLMDPSNK